MSGSATSVYEALESRVDAALCYVDIGWPVIPIYSVVDGLCSCPKASLCDSPGKHPRTRKVNPSCDRATVKEWWTKWPDANVAIAVGSESGIAVLDVDRHGDVDGVEGLRTLLEGAELPDTLTVSTGGGGRHLYFVLPDGLTRTRKIDGVGDLKASGYVLAPPSAHRSGQSYRFEPGRGLGEIEIAPFPEILAELLARQTPRVGQNSPPSGSMIYEGERNDRLARIAGAMRGQGCLESSIRAALTEENRTHCTPPLEDSEVVRIASSLATYPERRVHFAGGTYWPRETLKQLWGHPNELRLFMYIVSRAAWEDAEGVFSAQNIGVVSTSLRDIAGDLAWMENNQLRTDEATTVHRQLQKLVRLGFVRVDALPGLVTRIEVLNYVQFKGFSATESGGSSQHVTPRSGALVTPHQPSDSLRENDNSGFSDPAHNTAEGEARYAIPIEEREQRKRDSESTEDPTEILGSVPA